MSLNFLINKISGQGAGRSLFDSKVTRKINVKEQKAFDVKNRASRIISYNPAERKRILYTPIQKIRKRKLKYQGSHYVDNQVSIS